VSKIGDANSSDPKRNTGINSLLRSLGKTSTGRRYSFVLGLVTLVITALCALAGIYAKRYLDREFLGEQTRAIEQCRRNPQGSPELCKRLLNERGEIERSTYSATMRGPQQPPFVISDKDADLTPVSN